MISVCEKGSRHQAQQQLLFMYESTSQININVIINNDILCAIVGQTFTFLWVMSPEFRFVWWAFHCKNFPINSHNMYCSNDDAKHSVLMRTPKNLCSVYYDPLYIWSIPFPLLYNFGFSPQRRVNYPSVLRPDNTKGSLWGYKTKRHRECCLQHTKPSVTQINQLCFCVVNSEWNSTSRLSSSRFQTRTSK